MKTVGHSLKRLYLCYFNVCHKKNVLSISEEGTLTNSPELARLQAFSNLFNSKACSLNARGSKCAEHALNTAASLMLLRHECAHSCNHHCTCAFLPQGLHYELLFALACLTNIMPTCLQHVSIRNRNGCSYDNAFICVPQSFSFLQ